MKKMLLVSCLCSLMSGMSYADGTEQVLTKQLVHCGLVADNLAKSDPKYNQSSMTFIGAAGALAPDQPLVQMMMEDDSASPVEKMQQSEKENVIKSCESLLFANMDKVDAAISRQKK